MPKEDEMKTAWAEASTVSHREASLEKSALPDLDLGLEGTRTARSGSQGPARPSVLLGWTRS